MDIEETLAEVEQEITNKVYAQLKKILKEYPKLIVAILGGMVSLFISTGIIYQSDVVHVVTLIVIFCFAFFGLLLLKAWNNARSLTKNAELIQKDNVIYNVKFRDLVDRVVALELERENDKKEIAQLKLENANLNEDVHQLSIQYNRVVLKLSETLYDNELLDNLIKDD